MLILLLLVPLIGVLLLLLEPSIYRFNILLQEVFKIRQKNLSVYKKNTLAGPVTNTAGAPVLPSSGT